MVHYVDARTPWPARGPGVTAKYITTHKPYWLWNPAANFPMMVSYRQLERAGYAVKSKRKLYPSTHPWIEDSGGFTELSMYGEWRTTPREYVSAVARHAHEIGQLEWAASQDWMCEPEIIHGGVVNGKRYPGTHLSVAVHQHLTVLNYVTCVNLWPEYSDLPCPIGPTLTGWRFGEYVYCAELYRAAGIDLTKCKRVGLGTVCGRQNTHRIGIIASWFAQEGIRLHGFGVKIDGLDLYGQHLDSCDSAAWSYDAYRAGEPLIEGHTHQTCANCLPWAIDWHAKHFGSSELAA
jgi:hypothetical protein